MLEIDWRRFGDAQNEVLIKAIQLFFDLDSNSGVHKLKRA
jgi:hypothetical protein